MIILHDQRHSLAIQVRHNQGAIIANNNNTATNRTDGVNITTEEEEDDGDPNCPVCREEVVTGHPCIACDMCKTWFHTSCLFMSAETHEELSRPENDWFCARCLSIKANKIKWGEMEGEESIRACISRTYNTITMWRKNVFLLPRGKAGTNLIKELTRLLYLFIDNTKWTRLGISLVHIFLPLMLQKPSSKSKARDHAKYLEKRLQ